MVRLEYVILVQIHRVIGDAGWSSACTPRAVSAFTDLKRICHAVPARPLLRRMLGRSVAAELYTLRATRTPPRPKQRAATTKTRAARVGPECSDFHGVFS